MIAVDDNDWSGFSTRVSVEERDLGYIEATRLGGAIGFESASYTPLLDDAMAVALIDIGMSGGYALAVHSS